MKSKIVLAAAFALLLALPSFAENAPPCVRGTLASYIAQAGCMFGSALYDGFTYAAPATTDITADQIIVTPVLKKKKSDPNFVGFNFAAPWTAAAGHSQQSVIGYNVVPFPPDTPAPVGTLTLDLGQSQVSGMVGSVIVREIVSDAGTSAALKVYAKCEEVCSIKQQEQVTFSPMDVLQVIVKVSLSGGSNGASLKGFATNVKLCPQCAF
jgi:hypothetical protein